VITFFTIVSLIVLFVRHLFLRELKKELKAYDKLIALGGPSRIRGLALKAALLQRLEDEWAEKERKFQLATRDMFDIAGYNEIDRRAKRRRKLKALKASSNTKVLEASTDPTKPIALGPSTIKK
jgi:hypothetical protein